MTLMLTGNMAARYGVLPMLPLPQDEDLLTSFIKQMGVILAAPRERRSRMISRQAKSFGVHSVQERRGPSPAV